MEVGTDLLFNIVKYIRVKNITQKKKVREISFNPWVVDWTKAAHLE